MIIAESTLYRFAPAITRNYCYISRDSLKPMGELALCDQITMPPRCPNFSAEHPPYMPLDRERPTIAPDPEVWSVYLYSRAASDLMWGVPMCLIKIDYADELRRYDFTGIEFRPVNLYRDSRCTKQIDGYTELRIVGLERVDEKRSDMNLKFECDFCGARQYTDWDDARGLHFEHDFEEMPDLFQMEQRPGIIFTKPRFAQLIVDMGLRPVTFTRLEDIRPFWIEQFGVPEPE
jgi:hypothetical protein